MMGHARYRAGLTNCVVLLRWSVLPYPYIGSLLNTSCKKL